MTIVSKVKKNKNKERKSVCKRKKPTQGHFTSKNREKLTNIVCCYISALNQVGPKHTNLIMCKVD